MINPYQLLKPINIPVGYFVNPSPGIVPFLVYYGAGSDNFGADDRVYTKDARWNIELYVTKKDVALEEEKKAQEELAAAQAADKEKATAISAKEGQLTADQNAANQAKAAYETAQTVANEKAAALAAAEAAKKKAESSTTSTANVRQKFSVSQEYVNALKIHESKTATAAEKAQAEQVLKNVNKRDRGNNSYQDNEADKNVKISDLNNLSEAQITDLSLYASSLINQIRTAFGTNSNFCFKR